MVKKDYYKILGVERNADSKQIHDAYKKIVMKCHPNMQQNLSKEKKKEMEEKFIEANEAYETLKDVEKRKAYDMYGDENIFGNQNYDPFDRQSFFGQNTNSSFFGQNFNPSDIFSEFGTFSNDMPGFGGNSKSFFRKFTNTGSFDFVNLKDPDIDNIFSTIFGSKTQKSTNNTSTQSKKNQHLPKYKFMFTIDDFYTGCKKKIKIPIKKTGALSENIYTVQVNPGMKEGDEVIAECIGAKTINNSLNNVIIQLGQKPTNFTRNGDDLKIDVLVTPSEFFGASHKDINLPGGRPFKFCTADFKNAGEKRVYPNLGMPNEQTGRCGDLHVRLVVDFSQFTREKISDLLRICNRTYKN